VASLLDKSHRQIHRALDVGRSWTLHLRRVTEGRSRTDPNVADYRTRSRRDAGVGLWIEVESKASVPVDAPSEADFKPGDGAVLFRWQAISGGNSLRREARLARLWLQGATL